MTPGEFAAKWRGVETGERASAQSHFGDLCRMLGEPTPTDADPAGSWYAFEKGAEKFGGGEGFADVWKRGFFALEYKGKGRDLHAALRQLVDYKDALENPPLLIVSDLATIEVHTNFTGLSPVTRVVTLDDLARPAPSDALAVLRAVFTAPEELRPTHEPAQITETAARHFAELAQALRSRGHDPQAVARELGPLVSGQTGHPSGRWWRGRNALALGTLALISGCSPAATATPAASTSPSAAGASAMATASTPASAQACPWYIAATVSAANAGLPDTAAAYWLEPFQVAPGLRIVVSGTFPDARYASLQVYDAKTAPFTSNGLSSQLGSQPSARRLVRPLAWTRVPAARVAPQASRVVLAGSPALDEQPTRLIQEEDRDRSVEATGSQVRVELAHRAHRAPGRVDEFHRLATNIRLTHCPSLLAPWVPSGARLPDDDRVKREQQEQQCEVWRGELEEAPGVFLAWSPNKPDAPDHERDSKAEDDERDRPDDARAWSGQEKHAEAGKGQARKADVTGGALHPDRDREHGDARPGVVIPGTDRQAPNVDRRPEHHECGKQDPRKRDSAGHRHEADERRCPAARGAEHDAQRARALG